MKFGYLVGRILVAIALTVFALQGVYAAETYPSKTIRLVVGFAPGGATDLLARIVAQGLSERLGQSVIVENRGGAGGTVAAAAVAKSPADGYTFLVVSPSHAINATLYKTLPFDTLKDFVGVGTIATAPIVLVVHPSVQAKSVAEFIALAKSNPRSINLASPGTGSSGHLAGELFKSMAGIDLVHVPYKGTGEAIRDLLSGEVQSTIDTVSALLPYIESNKLRALGVGDTQRSPKLPDVPTISEAGVAGYTVFVWTGLVAAIGTPPEIISRVEKELTMVLQSPDVVKRIDDLGGRAFINSRASFDTLIGSEVARFARIIREAGVKVE